MSDQIMFTVPLVPVSVNHYVKHTRKGRHYVTKEAKTFKMALALFARGQKVVAKKYSVQAIVYLGKGKRGDGDNFGKVIGDSLRDAGVVHSDAAIKDWSIKVERDWERPRTEITVTAI
jgi:Holliday junction resolvase RusA-like endonuclease